MKTIFAIIALLVTMSVQAQSTSQQIPTDSRAVSALQSELEVKLSEVKTLEGSLGSLTVENERLMKENKVLADNRTEQNKRIQQIVEDGDRQLKDDQIRFQAMIDAIIAQYNATGCSGQITQDRLAYCQGLHRDGMARIEALKTNGTAHLVRERDRINAKLPPIREIINRQTARIEQIATTMTSNFKDFTNAQDRIKAHKERISELRLQINHICTNPNASLSAKQLCKIYRDGNWDGARTDLPIGTGPRQGTREGGSR